MFEFNSHTACIAQSFIDLDLQTVKPWLETLSIGKLNLNIKCADKNNVFRVNSSARILEDKLSVRIVG